jgi:hypothetical protein
MSDGERWAGAVSMLQRLVEQDYNQQGPGFIKSFAQQFRREDRSTPPIFDRLSQTFSGRLASESVRDFERRIPER